MPVVEPEPGGVYEDRPVIGVVATEAGGQRGQRGLLHLPPGHDRQEQGKQSEEGEQGELCHVGKGFLHQSPLSTSVVPCSTVL